MGNDSNFSRNIATRAARSPKRVVFAEAEHYKVLKAAEMAMDEGIAHPILLGRQDRIEALIEENNLELEGATILDPRGEDQLERRQAFGEVLV